jgi:hypothetical protein
MDTTTLLTILSIIATIVFGFLSIDLFKRKKNPGKLTLVKHSIIGLFNNIAKNFDEISMLYKSAPIKENVIYIRASIINDGDIDIEGDKVEKTINLKLDDGFFWIKSKITDKSSELFCENEINDTKSELEFNFGLIRKREHFQFEALIETENKDYKADDIFEKINISHRIANTQKVKQYFLLSEKQKKKKKKRILYSSLTFGAQIVFITVALIVQVYYFKAAPILYKTVDNIVYKAKATSDMKIELTNVDADTDTIISINEFQLANKYIPIIPKQTFIEKFKSAIYFLPILVLLVLILNGWEYLEVRKTNKINDILNQKN